MLISHATLVKTAIQTKYLLRIVHGPIHVKYAKFFFLNLKI